MKNLLEPYKRDSKGLLCHLNKKPVTRISYIKTTSIIQLISYSKTDKLLFAVEGENSAEFRQIVKVSQ